jgi:selenide, water dikinase
VTGFGLLGHLSNILDASEVAAEIYYESLPILAHARNLAARGIVSGGSQRNLAAAMTRTEWDESLEEADRILCADAQTSGGLLLAVPPENEARMLDALRQEGTPAAAVVGKIVQGNTGQITVKRRA